MNQCLEKKMTYKKLKDYEWKEPPWKCYLHMNEYWEYVKFAVLETTHKFVIVK